MLSYQQALDDLAEAGAKIAKIRALVDEQAADEGLWFEAETCAEAYVQQALRRLHAVIEGKPATSQNVNPDEGLPTAKDVRGILKP